jgi:hypothetical protein
MKAYGGVEVWPHAVLTSALDLSECSVEFYVLVTLPAGEEPYYPFNRGLCEPQNRSRCFGDE